MKTVKDLLNSLNKLVEFDPKYKDLPLIYSMDDEGNGYSKVDFDAALVQVHDLNENFLELVGQYKEDSEDIALEDCNCVLIN